MKNQNYLVLIIISLIIGFAVGFFVSRQATPAPSVQGETTKQESAKTHDNHPHSQKDVSGSSLIPTIELIIQEDPVSGWNAQILTTNFTFAPESVSTEDIEGEGHAHIYVDGVKVNRVYSPWYHLGELEPGIHEISATLSTNDHQELTIGSELIQDVEVINVELEDNMTDDNHHHYHHNGETTPHSH